MSKPRLLDLFCGAGGATAGYQRAGFHVTGVDLVASPNYCGDEFIQGNALNANLDGFAAVAASPPCQAYSTLNRFNGVEYPDLYEATRERLSAAGVPWVIENVIGAPYRSGVVLCGSMFGLKVRRHRNFETSFLVFQPKCDHATQGRPVGVYGHGQFYWEGGEKQWRNVPRAEAEEAMGIDWMSRAELSESIPPAFTAYIGLALLEHLDARAA